MKIDLQSQVPVYRNKAGADGFYSAAAGAAERRHDTVDIAHGSTAMDKELVPLKAGVHSHVSKPADPDRLSELQALVRSGEYHISTEELVNAMLGVR